METWKQIDGWPLYEVSNAGRVRSWNCRGKRSSEPRLMAFRPDRKGYGRVQLCQSGTQCERFVHQLVLEAFVGQRPTPWHEGRHFPDRDVRNNRADNLEWSTHAKNMRDQYAHGTRARGETHGMVKLSVDDVHAIRESTGPLKPVADRYGVHKATVCSIRRLHTWKHVPIRAQEATSPRRSGP